MTQTVKDTFTMSDSRQSLSHHEERLEETTEMPTRSPKALRGKKVCTSSNQTRERQAKKCRYRRTMSMSSYIHLLLLLWVAFLNYYQVVEASPSPQSPQQIST